MKRERAAEESEAGTSDEPCCHFCNQHVPGQVYNFWAGTLASSKEVGSALSNLVFIHAKYRNLKKCGVFVCHTCAARMRRRSHLPGVVGWGMAALVCLVGASLVAGVWQIVLGVSAAAAGLLWLLDCRQLIRPVLDSPRMDGLILERTRKFFLLKGKGDSFFTEAEYRALFRDAPSQAQTVEEILEQAGEQLEERPRQERREQHQPRTGGDTRLCPFCGGTIPSYAEACSWCKKILA